MKRPIACLLFTFVFVAECSAQYYYDRIAHIKGAPFSAEVHGTDTTRDSSTSWIVAIARAGDGSVYEATLVPAGEDEGTINHIRIQDAESNCDIDVAPFASHFTRDERGRWSGGGRGLSIGLEMGKMPVSPAQTIQDIRDLNQRAQQCSIASSQASTTDTPIRRTSLGQKTVDGMTIFGSRMEHWRDAKTDRVEERWESELGFPYSVSTDRPAEGSVFSHNVAGVKLAEPPAELFAVQDKYFPPTRTLPNARTIFVSGLDDAEMTRRIEAILTASGRFTLAPDSKTADVVLHAKYNPSYPGMQLGLQKPNGANLVSVSLRIRGELIQWAESPVVNTCFANLWKRVEGVQAPAQPMYEELF